VRALILALVSSWNRRDPDAFAGLFSPSAEYVTGERARVVGREEIAELVRRSNPGSQVTIDGPVDVELAGTSARVRFGWLSAGEAAVSRRGVIRCVVRRLGRDCYIDRLDNDEGGRDPGQ
jgi:hypothetical protein